MADKKSFGSTEKLPSGRYRAYYSYKGERVSAKGTFVDKVAAQSWLDDEQQFLFRVSSESIDLTSRSTFDEWSELFLRMPRREAREVAGEGGTMTTSKKAYKTVRSYESILRLHARPFLGEMRLCDINFATAREFQGYLEDKFDGCSCHKPGCDTDHQTTNRKAQLYSRYVLNLAQRFGVLHANALLDPRLSLPDGKVRRDPVEADTKQIATLVKAMHPNYAVAVFVAAYTGLRAGEIWGLTRSSINVVNGELLIDKQLQLEKGKGLVYGPPKGGRSRRIYLARPVMDALKTRLKVIPDHPSAPVFTTIRGKRVEHGRFMSGYFNDACEEAKMPEGFYFHDLRHFCAHWYIGHGFDVYSLMELLGHKSIKITLDIYGGRFAAKRRELADKASEIMLEEAAQNVADILPISLSLESEKVG